MTYYLHTEIGSYWLGSQYVETSEGIAYFGVRGAGNGDVSGYDLYDSDTFPLNYERGVRPAVSLKSTIKLEPNGDNSWIIK